MRLTYAKIGHVRILVRWKIKVFMTKQYKGGTLITEQWNNR